MIGAGNPSSGRLRPLTVLIAEDEDTIRTLVAGILREQGWRVLEAADGAQALAIAEDHRGPIDVLLTDVRMPRVGGCELAEKLTMNRAETKVLFMSGYAGLALRPGAAFLRKPFTPAVLLSKIREALDRERA